MKKLRTTVNTVISTDIEVEVEFPLFLKDKEGAYHKIEYKDDESAYCPYRQYKVRNYESGSVHLSDYDMSEASLSELMGKCEEITSDEYLFQVKLGIKTLEQLSASSIHP